jgi:23S rRNA (adenine2503-C2)-methyltransferase
LKNTVDIKADLRSLDENDLLAFCDQYGEPRFRAKQILDWIYSKRATSIQAMSNLSLELRRSLEESFTLNELRIEKVQGSKDTTQKFLIRLSDDQFIETVLIPASLGLYGDRSDRHTLCVSSQVGCAYGCKFCASGLDGFRRNLNVDEIIGQFLLAEKATGQKVNNLVFMGMGEPLANYQNVLKAIHIMNAPWGLGLGARKITVSTSGLAPQIKKLAEENFQVRLAISLHGARDEVRNQIMPINRKHPLADLISACEFYQNEKGRLITFEYILLDGINNAIKETIPLARLANKCHAKVNLIPFNEVEKTGFKRPSNDQCEQFRKELQRQGVTTTLRTEKGHDIDAACGQLRLKEIRSPKEAPTK